MVYLPLLRGEAVPALPGHLQDLLVGHVVHALGFDLATHLNEIVLERVAMLLDRRSRFLVKGLVSSRKTAV